jgi:tetratricopeptide (TPR) repeat protein
MSTTSPETPGAPAGGRRRSVLLLACLALGLAVLLAVAGRYAWRRYAAPQPPEVPLAGVDPSLAQAIETARRQVREDPYAITPWGELGELLRDCRLTEPAIASFSQAERLAPEDPRWPYLQGQALLASDPDAALPHLRRAVQVGERRHSDQVVLRLRLAQTLLSAGQMDEAEEQVRRSRALEPENPNVHLLLGQLAYARGDLEGAREHLLRCDENPFTRQKACLLLAAVCQRVGDPAAADQFSARAWELPPDRTPPDPFRSGSSRVVQGKPARFDVLEHLEGQHRYGDAVTLLRQMAEEGPEYRVYVGLGKNLAQLRRLPEAEEALRTAIRLEPNDAQAHYYLSKVLWAQAERRQQEGTGTAAEAGYRAAADCARQAIAKKPDHALAHLTLGLCLKELGQPGDALEELRRAVDCDPEVADAAFHYGEALARAGREAEARTYLERAVRLSRPDDTRPRAALEQLGAPRAPK